MVQALFVDILGQETALELMGQALMTQRIAPAYLFVGPQGVGRRLAAMRFAEGLLSRDTGDDNPRLRRRIEARNHPDLFWVEPTYLHKGTPVTVAEAEDLGVRRKSPPQIRLVQVRDLAKFLARPALEAPRSVVIIEGAETMAEAAANGLLKTLEEPGNASLILLASDSEALLSTIVSRCQQVPFRRLSHDILQTVLTQQGQADILAQADILRMAQGSPGAAIAAWEQLQALPENLMNTLQQPPGSLRQALDTARHISKELDTETQLWLLDYLQQNDWHARQSPAAVLLFEQARYQLRRFVQPRLVWEVMLMNLVP